MVWNWKPILPHVSELVLILWTGPRGSFRLFRSNSWSSRRKKTSEFSGSPAPSNIPINVETTHIQNNSSNGSKENDVNSNHQRSSPSYSTKSQDSGCFSENGQGLTTSSSNSQLIHNQRLQFLRSNMELCEDASDPNLTQINSADFPPKQSNTNRSQSADSNSKTKLTESLGNIASLQAGLNIKR